MRTAKTAPHARRDDCLLARQKIGHELSLARKKPLGIPSRSLCSHSFSFSAMMFRFSRDLPGFVYLGRLLSLTSLRFCRKMNTEVVIDKRIPDK